jgi:endonuclease YncB( thermonuclease family)
MIFWVVLLSLITFPAFAEDIIGVEYVACYDGDTCTVNIAHLPEVFGKKISIRLRGIDAPEINGKCASERQRARYARMYLNAAVSAAKVLGLKDVTRDKYFRLDVTLIADGVNMNDMMIQRGYARPYAGGKRLGWCS